MERHKGQLLIISVLCVCVLGLTIAFASLNTTLNVSGSANVTGSSWDVHFENLTMNDKTPTAGIVTAPSIVGGTSIGTYDITLVSPGDYVKYAFYVTNAGDYDAKISSITVPIPTCSATTQTDANNVCNKLEYVLMWWDINSEATTNIQVGDTLDAGESKRATFYLKYSSSAVLLPRGNVSVGNLGISFTFIQA